MMLGFTIAFMIVYFSVVITYNVDYNKKRNDIIIEQTSEQSLRVKQNIADVLVHSNFISEAINKLSPEIRDDFIVSYLQSNSAIRGISVIGQSRFLEDENSEDNYEQEFLFSYMVKGKEDNFAPQLFENIDLALSSDFYLNNTTNRAIKITKPYTYNHDMGGNYVVTFLYSLTDRFEGVLGIDVDVDVLMKKAKRENTNNTQGAAYILNGDEQIIATNLERNNLLGRKVTENINDTATYITFNKITSETTNERANFIEFIVPLRYDNVETELYFYATIDNNQKIFVFNQFARITLLIVVITAIVSYLLIFIYGSNITNPYIEITKYAKKLSKGNLSVSPIKTQQNDWGELAKSLNKIRECMQKVTKTLNSVADNEKVKPLESENDENEIYNTVNNMLEMLHTRKRENEMRQKEIEKNNWIRENLSDFSELIRQSSESFDDMSRKIIKEIVSILNANQAGLFIISEDENGQYLKLIASYAYNREKYMKKRVEMGDGLLGAVAVEKMTIHLSKLPSDYLEIESGTGGAQPKNLLIVPLKFEEKIYGVIEIASFNKFKATEIEFSEKVSEVVASSLSILSINEKNQRLLEHTQEQARQLADKERNLEDYIQKLEIAQQENANREVELKGVLDAIKSTLCVAEYDKNGTITDINQEMADLFQTTRDDMIGKNHKELTTMAKDEETFEAFWNDLHNGIRKEKKGHVLLPDGSEIWIQENFIPITDTHGRASKVLNIVIDNTNYKKLESKYQQLISH